MDIIPLNINKKQIYYYYKKLYNVFIHGYNYVLVIFLLIILILNYLYELNKFYD